MNGYSDPSPSFTSPPVASPRLLLSPFGFHHGTLNTRAVVGVSDRAMGGWRLRFIYHDLDVESFRLNILEASLDLYSWRWRMDKFGEKEEIVRLSPTSFCRLFPPPPPPPPSPSPFDLRPPLPPPPWLLTLSAIFFLICLITSSRS